MSTESNRKQLVVLSFHKIGEPPADGWNTWFYIPKETFVCQLNDLKAGGWKVLDCTQFLEGLRNPESLPERSVLITFDDGYRSMRTVVLPTMRSYALPAVLFVPTDFVGRRNTFDGGAEPDEAICNWEDLRELEHWGISIQSHGASHRHFSEMNLDDQKVELMRSKAALEDNLGKHVEVFAYPYGDEGANPHELRNELELAGYRAACLYRGGPVSIPVTDPFRLPRLPMGPDTNVDAVLARREFIPLP